jgi:hypothetical protein
MSTKAGQAHGALESSLGGQSADDPSPTSAGGSACLGSLAQLNGSGDIACPATWCEGKAWASNCSALPSGVTRTSARGCAYEQFIELLLASGETKTCYYALPLLAPLEPTKDADPELTAVALRSESPSYCDGDSLTVASGALPEGCSDETVLCDAASQTSPPPDAAEATCYGHVGFCLPCCPSTPPDCAGASAQDAPKACIDPESSWCQCRCGQDGWACGC